MGGAAHDPLEIVSQKLPSEKTAEDQGEVSLTEVQDEPLFEPETKDGGALEAGSDVAGGEEAYLCFTFCVANVWPIGIASRTSAC